MSWTKQQANSKTGGGNYEKPPPGNHPAVCVAIIDMGTQKQEYQGNVTFAHRAYFVWELVEEKQSGFKDRNHVIAMDLTVSLNAKSKLRKWIEARSGKQIPDGSNYDIAEELGKPCLLSVVMNGDYPKVDGMGAVPKGMTVAKPQNTPMIMSLEDFKAGQPIPEWVPYLFGRALADHINECKELNSTSVPPTGGNNSDPQPSTAPRGNGPPPRQRANSAEKRFYFDSGLGGEPENVLLTVFQIKQKAESGGFNVLEAAVTPEGGNDWIPILDAIPDARNWKQEEIPF